MTACTLVTSHIGPKCSNGGLKWSNGQYYHHCSSASPLYMTVTHWALFAISMIYGCMHTCHMTHWFPMLKGGPGMVKWSVSSLLFAISMIYDCMCPCHITHWALFAISMIYDCMHTCHITHWFPMLKGGPGMVKWSVSSLLFAISMIYDCMCPCHITHWSPMLKWWPGMVKWSVSSLLFAISMIYDCMHPRHITTLSHHKLVPNWSPTLEYDS